MSSALNWPSGTIFLYRDNFIQYARFGSMRCSNDYRWFCRLTAIRGVSDDGFEDVFFLDREDYSDDTVLSDGVTEVNK